MHISLYIHFPFCLRKCLYCDFNSLAGSRVPASEYMAAVIREMELRAERLDAPADSPTLYFGGGTPSLMEPCLVEDVIRTAARCYGLDAAAEITMEANPGTLTKAKLAGYRSAGVNRLSLGVQSFNDAMLSRLGRVHSAREAREAFATARETGFANIGIDLIHTLPGQTLAMWEGDLGEALSLAPGHVSAYGLTIEEGTPFHALAEAGTLVLPLEEEAVRMFQATSVTLQGAGYEQYEISNFALPGFRSRHNQVYWRRESYLGFGAGAHSFMGAPPWGIRWKNPDSSSAYLDAISRDTLPEEEVSLLGKRDAMAERLFLGLRMREGVADDLFRREFGMTIGEAYPDELPELLAAGLLQWQEGALRLSERGLIISNQVFVRFV